MTPLMRSSARLALFCLLGPARLAAQDTAIVINPESASVAALQPTLPRLVAEEAVRLYNAPTTTRLVGRSRLPRGNEWRGEAAGGHGGGAPPGPGAGAPPAATGGARLAPAAGGPRA